MFTTADYVGWRREEKGREEGENKVIRLFSKLYNEGRASDAKKATEDKEFLEQLYEEFKID